MNNHFGGTPSCRWGQATALPPTPSAAPTSVPPANKEVERGSAEEIEIKECYLGEEFRSTRGFLENCIFTAAFPCYLFQCARQLPPGNLSVGNSSLAWFTLGKISFGDGVSICFSPQIYDCGGSSCQPSLCTCASSHFSIVVISKWWWIESLQCSKRAGAAPGACSNSPKCPLATEDPLLQT